MSSQSQCAIKINNKSLPKLEAGSGLTNIQRDETRQQQKQTGSYIIKDEEKKNYHPFGS